MSDRPNTTDTPDATDALLDQLAALAREENDEGAPLSDPRWALYAEGDGMVGEEELRGLAGEAEVDADAAAAAISPLSEDFLAKLTDGAMASLEQAAHSPERQARNEPDKVVSLAAARDKRRRTWGLVAAGITAAAAAALFAILTGSPSFEPIPDYSLDRVVGVSTVRGSDEPVKLRPGQGFEILARPGTSVAGAVGARVWLLQGNAVTELSAKMDISEQGAMRIRGTVPADAAKLGQAQLVVAVGRPGALKSLAPKGGSAPQGTRRLTTPVQVVE